MKEAHITECEFMSGLVEPVGSHATAWWVAARRDPGFPKMREDARRCRLSRSVWRSGEL